MSAKLLVHFSRKKKNGYLSFNSFSKGERLEGEKCKKGLKQQYSANDMHMLFLFRIKFYEIIQRGTTKGWR